MGCRLFASMITAATAGPVAGDSYTKHTSRIHAHEDHCASRPRLQHRMNKRGGEKSKVTITQPESWHFCVSYGMAWD